MIDLSKIGNEIINSIKQTMIEKDLNDTKGTSESLRYEADEKSLTILGSKTFEYLNRGSGIWLNPDNYKALGFILSDKGNGWAGRKANINPYAAAYIIAHEGSQIHKDKSKGLELNKIQDKGNKLIQKSIAINTSNSFIQDIKEMFKGI